jgi:hypothetical protein
MVQDSRYPTTYYRPFDIGLTEKYVKPYTTNASFPDFGLPDDTIVFEIFTFPVYGTDDPIKPASLLSTILYFEPANYRNFYGIPLVFALSSDVAIISGLKVENYQLSQTDFLVTQPGSTIQFFNIYEQFNPSQRGESPEIAIEIFLEKDVFSNKSISYKPSLFAPISFSPQSTPPIVRPQRVIRVMIKPTVSVTSYSPRDVYTLLGSMAGIFTVFVTSGGFFVSLIWLQVGKEYSDDSKVELDSINSEQ